MNQHYIEGADRQIRETLAAGGRVLTLVQLKAELARLGYRIESSFSYTNTSNGYPWAARACYIVEADTGLGFANVKARRDDNFKALQALRFASVTVNRGRVYEI